MLPGHINVVPGVKSIASCILDRHSTNELTFSTSRLLDLTNKIGIPLLSLELSESLVISRKILCASAGFISLHPQVLKPHASIHLHGFPEAQGTGCEFWGSRIKWQVHLPITSSNPK